MSGERYEKFQNGKEHGHKTNEVSLLGGYNSVLTSAALFVVARRFQCGANFL